MSKKSKIRWRKEDSKELANAVRVFNSKLTRSLKKNPELAEYLPARISTSDIRAKVETRQDFNREINSLKRFMKKGAEMPIYTETGIKTTKWEVKEVGIKVATVNRQRTRERKEAAVSPYKGTMGTIRENNLLPKKYDVNTIKASAWDKFKATLDKQVMSTYTSEKMELYKANYIKGMKNVLGHMGEELVERISEIDAEALVRMYYDDPVMQIDFVYDPQEVMFLVESIEDHLESNGY